MVSEETDDFKLVKYGNRRSRKTQLRVNKDPELLESDCSVDEIIDKTNAALQKFKDSPFNRTLLDSLKDSLDRLDSAVAGILDIICYGLGNFSHHNCSKYQLAALLSVKSVYPCNAYIYDPIFTPNEIASLKLLDLRVIESNEEGKRIINDRPTLVFMPHCSKQLTNNFLHANWTPLISNCVLLGNSWSELECNTTDALLRQTAHFVYRLKPYATEIKLRNNFHYPNTFSGTSLHIFTREKLDKIPVDFWEEKPDLERTEDDPEFVAAARR